MKLDNIYFGDLEFGVLEKNKLLDFKSKKEVGTVFTVLSVKEYKIFKIKVVGKMIEQFQNVKRGCVVEFDGLEANVYFIKGKVVVSCSAKDVFVSFEKKGEDMFMSLDEEYGNE